MAAALEKDDPGLKATIVRGGFMELSITIDGRRTITTHRFFGPPQAHLVDHVKAALNGA